MSKELTTLHSPTPLLPPESPTSSAKFVEESIKLKPWSKEWWWELRASTFVIIFTVTLAIFSDIFVYAVIVPVVPFLFVTRMGISEDSVQGQVSLSLGVYSIGLIVGAFIFGYISDKVRQRRTLMLAGLVIVLGSTLIICLSKAMWLYHVGRVIQGLSGSMVWTVGLAIIADTGDADNMAYLMSYPTIGTSLGIFLGPFLGGILYKRSGYYPLFYLCFAVLALDIALRLFMLERSELKERRHQRAVELSYDNPLNLSPSMFTYMNRYIDQVDDSSEVEARQERLQRDHGTYIKIRGKRYRLSVMISLLQHSRILNAILLGIAISWILTAMDATIAIHTHDLFGFDSMQAGLVFLAAAVPTVFDPLVGMLADKCGPKFVISGGFFLMTPILILLRLPHKHTSQQIVLFFALMILLGFCIMAVSSPALAEMTKAVTAIEAMHPGIYGKGKGFGQAYGLFNVGFAVGTLVGPFQAGATFFSQGWDVMALSLGVMAFCVGIISFLFAGHNIFKSWHRPANNEHSSRYEA